MGSPEFAVPTLTALVTTYQVVGVITQPDRPAGRGQKLCEPPIKQVAMQLGIPVIQPEKIRNPDVVERIAVWKPELIVVAAFGQILRQNLFDLPKYGCLNVHASVLPRWRGASPIQAAILNGDDETGVTIMKINAGLDTGAILSQERVMISPDETAGVLGTRLADLGANLLIHTIPQYLSGAIKEKAQDDSLATFAPLIKKENAILDFDDGVVNLVRKVRAFNPWPGTYTKIESLLLKIKKAYCIQEEASKPGWRIIKDGLPAIGTRDGFLILTEVQPAGKRTMTGEDFLRGMRNWISID